MIWAFLFISVNYYNKSFIKTFHYHVDSVYHSLEPWSVKCRIIESFVHYSLKKKKKKKRREKERKPLSTPELFMISFKWIIPCFWMQNVDRYFFLVSIRFYTFLRTIELIQNEQREDLYRFINTNLSNLDIWYCRLIFKTSIIIIICQYPNFCILLNTNY